MMKKILVPFDGSETALRALEFAAGIGKPFGSEIMVVNVIVPYDYTKVPPRKPKNAIEEAKTAEADMIVLGNRGMGMLAELLMGSVSMKISQYAECPVVIVK